MATDPRPWIAALRKSHDRLASLARPLTAEQLRAQSYCTDWSIAQVLSHLGSGADGRLDAGHTPAEVSSDGVDLDRLRAVFPGF